jgi:DNA-binding transcriptional ArsR family regulator
MDPSERPPTDVTTLTEAKALAALANPHRSRILDALKVDGPSTASMLALRTGIAVGSASHHLKVLADGGLVIEAPELAKDRRERWWRLATPGLRWSRAEFPDDGAAVAAAREAEALALQRQTTRAQEWMANSDTMGDWDDAAFATQNWFHLTPDELRRLSGELLELLARWSERAIPDDGVEREPVLVFARGFPAQP